MFQVLFPQVLIEGLPLEINTLDHFGSKIFVGTMEGSVLEYEIEEDPFTIQLKQVHKNIKQTQLIILPKSRSLGILIDGVLSLADYTSQELTLVQVSRIKGISTIARSSYSYNDNIAIGVKNGLILLTVSVYEATESELISLPATPMRIDFVSEHKVVVSTKKSIYLVDLTLKTLVEIFKSEKTTNPSACSLNLTKLEDDRLVIQNSIYCTKELEFFKINPETKETLFVFNWSRIPKYFTVDDYYACGLIGDQIEVRSLKTGLLLQNFQLTGCELLVFGETTFTFSKNNVWRLLPLDFDDQIDELLLLNRFKDAQILIEELEFQSEDDKQANIIKVKGVYAQYLFNVMKDYDAAIVVLESLKASPLDIIELYPDLMDESDGQPSDPDGNYKLSSTLSVRTIPFKRTIKIDCL
jgi:hypothetical protein